MESEKNIYYIYYISRKSDTMASIKKLNEIGNSLGLSKDEIKSALKRRKREILFALIPVVAVAINVSVLNVLGVRYGGASAEDFEILKRFRFLRFLLGLP